MTLEGVDYSRTAGSDWAGLASALKAQGKHFIGRYAVNDLSPNGRGIGPDEYAAMTAAGLEVFLYWESSKGWMRGGEAAGEVAAVNAQQNINRAGMPSTIPVYFAADDDFTPGEQELIDDCLRGCAKVLGPQRVGIYGGFHVVRRCATNGSAVWFAQTSAWSGGNWFAGNHLEQYDYNHIINGTNCDDVRALQPHYGQASDFLTVPVPDPIPEPVPPPAPVYAKPAGITWAKGDVGVQDLHGAKALAFLLELTCTNPKGAVPLQSSTKGSKPTGATIKPGERVVGIGSYRAGSASNAWVVLADGSRARRSSFRPLAPLL